MANQIIKALVLGAQFSEFEGNFYGKIFIAQPVGQEDAESAKGLSVMSIDITKEAYQSLTLPSSPVDAEIDVRMKRAAKNQMKMECLHVRLVSTPSPKSQQKS